jgi:hypothetical protein
MRAAARSTAIIADRARGRLPAGLDGARASHSAANERYIGNEEPSIEELLTDPIAALLRCRDGLSLDDVCRCMPMRWHGSDFAPKESCRPIATDSNLKSGPAT